MLTAHSKIRLQQRAIPQSIVNLLLDYGERAPAGQVVTCGKRYRRIRRG